LFLKTERKFHKSFEEKLIENDGMHNRWLLVASLLLELQENRYLFSQTVKLRYLKTPKPIPFLFIDYKYPFPSFSTCTTSLPPDTKLGHHLYSLGRMGQAPGVLEYVEADQRVFGHL